MQEIKPDAKAFTSGRIRCECGEDVSFDSSQGLELVKCACGRSSFIPKKISNLWLYMPLGGGGMGSVYKAVTEDKKIICAVKILPRDQRENPEFIKNLLAEVNAAQKFGFHKNLVRLINAGQSDGEYFMATEFIDGDRLDRYVSSHHQLPEREAFSIMRQVLDAEKQIVSCGYLFRDLKPENIIVEKNGNIRLFDYGLCKEISVLSEPSHQSEDQIEGSPFYLPPERIVGATEGEYSEIYSMGMLFFYMLAGRTYYSEAEVNDLVSKHLTAIRIVSTAPHLSNCNSKTVSTIDRMIQRKPNMRMASLSVLEDAFKEIEEEFKSGGRSLSFASRADKETSDGRSPLDGLPPEAGGFSGSKKPLTPARLAAGVISVMVMVFLALFYSYTTYKYYKVKNELAVKAAAQLGVSPDILGPPSTPQEIKKMIDDKFKETFDDEAKKLSEFDEDEAKDAICEKFGIEKFPVRKPEKTFEELQKLTGLEIDALCEEQLKGRVIAFDEKKAETDVSLNFAISLPPEPPKLPLENVKEEFEKFTKKTIEVKYGKKAYMDRQNKVFELYGGYKKGDKVKFTLLSGEILEGTYDKDTGDKLIIGGKMIQKKDFSAEELWRFNPDICAKKISQTISALKKSFDAEKKECVDNFEKAEKDKFYKERKYMKSPSGEYLPFREYVDLMVEEARKKNEKDTLELKEVLRAKLEKEFDKEKYLKKSGYVLVGGKYVPTVDAVENEMKASRKKFDIDRKKELDELRKKVLSSVQKEVYTANNYVFHSNSWFPARQMIDSLVAVGMAELGY